MSVNTFSAIRTICYCANTTDKVVTAIAKLAGRWFHDRSNYEGQLAALSEIRDMAHGRLGANDISWAADGALNAIFNITEGVIGEDN